MPAADSTPGSVRRRASTRSSVADGWGPISTCGQPRRIPAGRVNSVGGMRKSNVISWSGSKCRSRPARRAKLVVRQGGADEEHERDRNLAGDERAPQELLPTARSRPAAAP